MRFFLFFLSLCISQTLYAQYYGTFVVNGDIDKFYPVIFTDQNWFSGKATVLEIGRHNVHEDSDWRGSLIARFSFHLTHWGNGSNFIDASIRQFNPVTNTIFIGGWTDASTNNATNDMIVWLKGGGTTYHFTSPSPLSPTVYDDNSIPYQEPNGPLRSFKTVPDIYVNSLGSSSSGTAFYMGVGNNNYFAGNVGIGTPYCDAKLTVNGDIHARSVKVDVNIPIPDYVFGDTYKLRSLKETEDYVTRNHHLPDVPSEAQFKEQGIDVTKMNMTLLKKVEELTLHLIIKDKQIDKIIAKQNLMKSSYEREFRTLKQALIKLKGTR